MTAPAVRKTLRVEQMVGFVGAEQVTVYKVRKVTNCTSPSINETLYTEQLEVYCEARDWQVTVV